MTSVKLNVISAIGDPRSPRTWSGTPYNITNVLIKNDNLGEVFESCENNYMFKIIKTFYKLLYRMVWFGKRNNSLPFRFRLIRHLNGRSAVKYLDNIANKNVLHFGTLSLPFNVANGKQDHYVYIDGTWDLWSKNATDLKDFNSYDYEVIDNLENQSFNNVRHIFSISEFVKRNLIEKYGITQDKITVVGTGTGVIKPFFGNKDYTNGKILFAAKGRFKDKGGELVLQSFFKALETFPHLQLSIVGQNDYSDTINHPNIKTFGFIPIDELQELFDSHSLFLMPALNEPWGLVYIEAMLCKMPIVGLNRNSFPELSGYGSFGRGIDSPDSDVLASTIIDIIRNPEELERMGKRAQEFALSTFTWENTVKKILTVTSNITKNENNI